MAVSEIASPLPCRLSARTIVVLRTMLNYFLQQEIDKAQVRSPAHGG